MNSKMNRRLWWWKKASKPAPAEAPCNPNLFGRSELLATRRAILRKLTRRINAEKWLCE